MNGGRWPDCPGCCLRASRSLQPGEEWFGGGVQLYNGPGMRGQNLFLQTNALVGEHPGWSHTVAPFFMSSKGCVANLCPVPARVGGWLFCLFFFFLLTLLYIYYYAASSDLSYFVLHCTGTGSSTTRMHTRSGTSGRRTRAMPRRQLPAMLFVTPSLQTQLAGETSRT